MILSACDVASSATCRCMAVPRFRVKVGRTAAQIETEMNVLAKIRFYPGPREIVSLWEASTGACNGRHHHFVQTKQGNKCNQAGSQRKVGLLHNSKSKRSGLMPIHRRNRA